MSVISHLGDPTLNKASEWLCKVCGHSEDQHTWGSTSDPVGCAVRTEGVPCTCDGFEDKEDE